jgi:hypothetical protein
MEKTIIHLHEIAQDFIKITDTVAREEFFKDEIKPAEQIPAVKLY